jgi:AraC family transcriptional regulator of arabinose operon
MKTLKLNVTSPKTAKVFQIHRLGLHEVMPPCMVNRPEGTGDYLFMLFHGDIRIKYRAKDHVWPASSMMMWTPKDGHFYGKESDHWNHSWFHCAGRAVAQILKASRFPTDKPFEVTDASLMEHYLLETVTELNGWRGPNEMILRNLFENFILALVRQEFAKTKRLAPARLLEVKSYMEQHFAENLRLPDLAKSIGWSVPHFCTEFGHFFGIPAIQYIQQLRMNQAAYLLRDHNRRISEIAGLVGYPDVYAFSKMFKRYQGVSPLKFRHLNTQ